jgi:hypothetical protein
VRKFTLLTACVVVVAALAWYFATPPELTSYIKFFDDHNGAITAVSTVFLTLITAGLARIGYVQIMTTRAQLRAYVRTSRTVVTNVSHGTGAPEAQVTIQNSGQTPAYDVVSVSGFAIDRYPSTPDLVITDGEFANSALGREILGPGENLCFCHLIKTRTSYT